MYSNYQNEIKKKRVKCMVMSYKPRHLIKHDIQQKVWKFERVCFGNFARFTCLH